MTSMSAATALAAGLLWIYFLRRSRPTSSAAISILLLLHSLLLLRTDRPPNIFVTLRIPLHTPTDAIRALLLQHSPTPDLSPELDGLLRRLASFDARALYARFGHNVLATCTYCHSFDDFALYALPRPVLSYIREIAFIGVSASFQLYDHSKLTSQF